MFIDKYTWLVGDVSEEELEIAKRGPQNQTYAPIIAFMIVFGVLGVTTRIFVPEFGAVMLIIWVECAIALGCYVAITVRQRRKYSRLMSGRTVHQVEDDDPFDRLMHEVDDDRGFLDRHSATADILFERTSAWEDWRKLCEHPDLSEEEKVGLTERINSDVRDIACMMRDLEAALLGS